MAVYPYAYDFTSKEGMKGYYDHLRYWHTCVANTKAVIVPTREEAQEYLAMLRDKDFDRFGSEVFRKYEERYDWRAQKFEENGCVGLISPTGELILPAIFTDVFDQIRAVPYLPDFVPVFNGEAWALASTGGRPVMVTDFSYRRILPERWDGNIFFVQDAETGRWGALRQDIPHQQPIAVAKTRGNQHHRTTPADCRRHI